MKKITNSDPVQHIIYLVASEGHSQKCQLDEMEVFAKNPVGSFGLPTFYHSIFTDKQGEYNNFEKMIEYARPNAGDTLIFYSAKQLTGHLPDTFIKLAELYKKGLGIALMLDGIFMPPPSNGTDAKQTFLFHIRLAMEMFTHERMKLIE